MKHFESTEFKILQLAQLVQSVIMHLLGNIKHLEMVQYMDHLRDT